MFRINHCFCNCFTDSTHLFTSFWVLSCWNWLFRCSVCSFLCCCFWSLSCCCFLSSRCTARYKRINIRLHYSTIIATTCNLFDVNSFFTCIFTNRWHRDNTTVFIHFCSWCCSSWLFCLLFWFFSFRSIVRFFTFKLDVFISRSIKFNKCVTYYCNCSFLYKNV